MKKIFCLFTMFLVFCLLGSLTPASAQSKGPIRVGFLAPLSGGLAQNGKDMLDGFQLYLEEISGQMEGRKVEFIPEDTEGQPARTLTKARKLVENDKVHILVGPLLASSGYALLPYVNQQKIPNLMPITSADDLTQRKASEYIIRTGWTSSQPSHPFGEWVYKTLGYKKIAAIGLDYSFGWEVLDGFQRTFEESGGKIVQKLWTPFTVQDFSPYLAQIPKDVDAVFANFGGKYTIQFAKQYQDFGLKGRIPLIGSGIVTDEHALPSMGDEALGIITALHYSAAIDTPENKAFVKAYRAKYNKPPGYFSEGCYTGGRWMSAAVKAVNGKVEDRRKFLEALKKVEMKTAPRGPMIMDAYGNPIENIYIRKVERVGGELQNSIIHTFPNVSQFWKYNPKEYMQKPFYGREYTP